MFRIKNTVRLNFYHMHQNLKELIVSMIPCNAKFNCITIELSLRPTLMLGLFTIRLDFMLVCMLSLKICSTDLLLIDVHIICLVYFFPTYTYLTWNECRRIYQYLLQSHTNL